MENIKKIIEEIKENNGGTYNKNLKSISANRGFMVSLQGYEVKCKTDEEIEQAITKNMEIVKGLNSAYLGAWIDEGITYIDISVLVENKEDALEMGKINNQLAIYDLQSNASIYLSYYYTVYRVVRNKDNDIIDYKIYKQYNYKIDIVAELRVKEKRLDNVISDSIYNVKQVLMQVVVLEDTSKVKVGNDSINLERLTILSTPEKSFAKKFKKVDLQIYLTKTLWQILAVIM